MQNSTSDYDNHITGSIHQYNLLAKVLQVSYRTWTWAKFAGSMLELKSSIYRPAQQCQNHDAESKRWQQHLSSVVDKAMLIKSNVPASNYCEGSNILASNYQLMARLQFTCSFQVSQSMVFNTWDRLTHWPIFGFYWYIYSGQNGHRCQQVLSKCCYIPHACKQLARENTTNQVKVMLQQH